MERFQRSNTSKELNMIRSPDLSITQLEALELLLKIDYTRKVRSQLQWMLDANPDLTAVLAEIMKLTYDYNDRNTPMVVSRVLAEGGMGHTKMSLNEERFSHYVKLADLTPKEDDFPGVARETVLDILPKLRRTQTQIQAELKNAGTVRERHNPNKVVLN
jgi:hypothetical protein